MHRTIPHTDLSTVRVDVNILLPVNTKCDHYAIGRFRILILMKIK